MNQPLPSFRVRKGELLQHASRTVYRGYLGIPMIVTADSGDRDRAVPGPWI